MMLLALAFDKSVEDDISFSGKIINHFNLALIFHLPPAPTTLLPLLRPFSPCSMLLLVPLHRILAILQIFC